MCLAGLAAPPICFGQTHARMSRELEAAVAAKPHTQAVAGVCVIDLATRATIYSKNMDLPLIPASNAKIFVMAAALAEMGPAFSFETILGLEAGNLVVIGDGDPAFGDEKLAAAHGETITSTFERWAGVLADHGVTVIPGDLVIDGSIFDEQRTHPSWDERDLGKWYAAPTGGLNFNDNCVDITVSPGDKAGAPVRVLIQPVTSLVNIVNKCRTGEGEPILHHPAGTLDYVISKRCAKPWRFVSVAFPDPEMLFADSLRTVLAGRGIRVGGVIRRERIRLPDGRLPATLTVLGRHRTPIADVLKRAGKNSQNLFAECLLKRVGYEWARRQGRRDACGSWVTGAEAVMDVIRRAGIDTTGLAMMDGSGLSRDNRCTAAQLARTAAWMLTQPGGRLFHDSLSVAGVDGSLRKRLSDQPGIVHGKTGTMRGVRTLSGYVDAPSGPRYAFAVMFSGYKGPSAPYRELQDRICRILIKASDPASGGR